MLVDFLSHALKQQWFEYIQAVVFDCEGVGSVALLQTAMWMLITASCWFYTLFLFDILGDKEGFQGAYWVLIVLPTLPLCLYILNYAFYGNVHCIYHELQIQVNAVVWQTLFYLRI
jgi:hypothetical protein